MPVHHDPRPKVVMIFVKSFVPEKNGFIPIVTNLLLMLLFFPSQGTMTVLEKAVWAGQKGNANLQVHRLLITGFDHA